MSDPVLYVVDGHPVSRDEWGAHVRLDLGLSATQAARVRGMRPDTSRTIGGHTIQRTLAVWVPCHDCGTEDCGCNAMGGTWHCYLCSAEWEETRRSCANPACEGHEDEEEVDRAAE